MSSGVNRIALAETQNGSKTMAQLEQEQKDVQAKGQEYPEAKKVGK